MPDFFMPTKDTSLMKAMLTTMNSRGGKPLGVNSSSDLGEIRVDILRALIEVEVGAGVGIHFGLESGIGGGEFVDSVEGGDELLNLIHGEGVLASLGEVWTVGRLSGQRRGVQGCGQREYGEAGGQNAERLHGRMDLVCADWNHAGRMRAAVYRSGAGDGSRILAQL
jgi:hypothetical protein